MREVPVWAEIDLKAIVRNMQEIRRLVSPRAGIMAVVKANAYGHGAVEVAQAALANGAGRLAVATIAEGKELRAAGINVPILLLGYTPYSQFAEVVDLSLAQAVYTLEMAAVLDAAAARLGKRATVHIKIDTGMGRLGLQCGEVATKEALQIARLPHLNVEGIFTHFATADSRDKSYARLQFNLFVSFLDGLRKAGLEIPLQHCANSAALIDLPQTHLNLVRPGIIIYGLYPSDEVQRSLISLQPAMTFKTRVAQVKNVPANCKISYGAIYRTPRPTVIATLPVGYADGYNRLLSSKGKVLIHGQRAEVVGRVCMDLCMVDAGYIDGVCPGDEVVLFGRQGEGVLPVEEVAEAIGTINYEVVCMVNSRAPRVYLK
ncbi:MAG TPA: alanine racemase [Desulfotomaculum sp.]|nr:alanine racemase [Desulfotomaculum sp.]